MLYLSYISHCNRFHCTVNSVLQYIVHILFYSTSLCSIVHLCVLALFPSGFCVLVRTFHPSVLPQFYTVLTCTTCTACITLYRSVLDLASHRIASQYISVCTSLYVHLFMYICVFYSTSGVEAGVTWMRSYTDFWVTFSTQVDIGLSLPMFVCCSRELHFVGFPILLSLCTDILFMYCCIFC